MIAYVGNVLAKVFICLFAERRVLLTLKLFGALFQATMASFIKVDFIL